MWKGSSSMLNQVFSSGWEVTCGTAVQHPIREQIHNYTVWSLLFSTGLDKGETFREELIDVLVRDTLLQRELGRAVLAECIAVLPTRR